MRPLLLPLFLFSMLVGFTQPRTYTTANAHSHNDYMNEKPFYLAFSNGFGSIEADVFSINDTLFVAHNKQDIRPGRTLRRLYLDPLLHAFDSSGQRKLVLLIDIKDDVKMSLPLLVKELEPLKKYLSTQRKKKNLTIVISGNRLQPSEYKDYPDYIFFDDDLYRQHTTDEWKRVALVSSSFSRVSHWNGKDSLNTQDWAKMKRMIKDVHSLGKPIRFWAAPDTELSWKMQMDFKVDLIGTDKISELAAFLRRQTK